MQPRHCVLLAVVVGVQSVGIWLSKAPLFLVAHLYLGMPPGQIPGQKPG